MTNSSYLVNDIGTDSLRTQEACTSILQPWYWHSLAKQSWGSKFVPINEIIYNNTSEFQQTRLTIDLFHKNFPLADSSPNTVTWLMSYNNQLPVV